MKRGLIFGMLFLVIIMFLAIFANAQGENHAPFVSNVHAVCRMGSWF
jgi:hypothetical protein